MELFLPAEAEDADAVEYGKDIKKRTPNIIFGVLFFISILIYKNSKSVKKTLTIPAWLNDRALAKGINFSQLLQEALVEKTM